MKLHQLAALMKLGNTMPHRHHYQMPEPGEDRQRPTFEAHLTRARPQQRQPVAITDHLAQTAQPVRPQQRQPVAITDHLAQTAQPVRHQETPEFVAPEAPVPVEQPVRHQETPELAVPENATPAGQPVPQPETPADTAPVSSVPIEAVTLEFFKQLLEDASDRKYPLDGTKLRAGHENYARMLLDRARAAQAQMGAAAAAEGSYSGQSWGAQHTTFDQIFAALDEVERFMDDQAQRVAAGENVSLIDGRHRHLLGDALGKLYLEMKDFYNA